MSGDYTVTISAEYFAELYRKANETDNICKECKEERTAEEFTALRKECDELKKRLDCKCNECVSYEDILKARLAAAKRCIEDIDCDLKRSLALDDENSPAAKSALEIIRAYREQEDAE